MDWMIRLFMVDSGELDIDEYGHINFVDLPIGNFVAILLRVERKRNIKRFNLYSIANHNFRIVNILNGM